MKKVLPQWQQITMCPPTSEWAGLISNFLQAQLDNPLQERSDFAYWKLCINEAHHGFASAMVIDPDEQIVSICTVTPKRLWREGKEHFWGEMGDTFTDSAFQGKGMFGALGNACRVSAQDAGFNILYGLPNDLALPGWIKRCGFVVKEDLLLDGHILPISTKALGLRTRLSRIPWLSRALCHSIVADTSRGLARLAISALKPGHTEINIERVESFGPDFDQLWDRVRTEISNLQVRDSRYLVWRYRTNQFPFVVFSAKNGNQLLGYVVTLTLRHNDGSGLSHTMLMDWLYDPGLGSSTPRALLFAAVRHAFEQKADVISALLSRGSPLPLPFSSAGLIRIKRKMPVMFYGNSEGRSILADPSPWHFTLSDTDSF